MNKAPKYGRRHYYSHESKPGATGITAPSRAEQIPLTPDTIGSEKGLGETPTEEPSAGTIGR